MGQDPHRPKVAVETLRPFRELFDTLQQAGFETEHRPPLEQRSDGPVALMGTSRAWVGTSATYREQ
jgi:hypothetical protein